MHCPTRVRILFLAFLLLASPSLAADDMPDLVRQYQADEESVTRYYNLPASEATLARRERVQTNWLARLAAVNVDGLDQSGKVDYVLLTNKLRQSLAGEARERQRLKQMDQLLAFRGVIHELETARWRAAPVDPRATATRLAELARQVKALRGQVGKLPGVTPPLAQNAAKAVAELRETLKKWFAFYDGYQPEFTWWVAKPHEEAGRQLDDYAKALREELAGLKGHDDDPLVGQPLGAESLAADIGFQFLPYTAEELIAIGERELTWCEGQRAAAARAMGLGDDWRAAMARVKADYAPPGRQDELVARIAREATEFVVRRKLVDVPPLCAETWRLTMISPETMKTIPYAAYGGQQIMVAYPREEMSQDDKLMVMRGNNRHFMRLVTPHELIPGHHLQAFYAARYNTYRELFGTPFYFEGWALYWEMRLWDLDWARTPEDRIGMLFWRMTRAARIVVTLKYHLGRMKPPEMVDFLIDRVGHERLGATAEVRRFIGAFPLYQAGYTIGGRQIDALRREMVAPGKLSERQFHDAVLKAGPIPIELLRAEMENLPLGRDAKPTWRFDK